MPPLERTRALVSLAASAHENHLDIPTAALQAQEPLTPLPYCEFRAVGICRVRGIGCVLMLAGLAQHDQLSTGFSGSAEG